MKRLSQGLYRLSSGRVALLVTLFFVLFTILVLPQQSRIAAETAGDAGSPDMSFMYSASDLYEMAEGYGEEGRNAYIRARFTFDLVWPLVYTLFLAVTLSWVLQRLTAPLSALRRLNLVPLLGALFDYLENLSTSLVMARYPMQTPVVDLLAPFLTFLKWIFVYASFVLLLVGLVLVVWQVIRTRKGKRG